MNYILELFVVAVLIMTPIFLVGYWGYKLMVWLKARWVL